MHRYEHTVARGTLIGATVEKLQQGLPDHFNKIMDSPCTNHAYPIKHLYKDCELLKCFLRQAGGPKEGDGKEAVAKKGGAAGKDGTASLTLRSAS